MISFLGHITYEAKSILVQKQTQAKMPKKSKKSKELNEVKESKKDESSSSVDHWQNEDSREEQTLVCVNEDLVQLTQSELIELAKEEVAKLLAERERFREIPRKAKKASLLWESISKANGITREAADKAKNAWVEELKKSNIPNKAAKDKTFWNVIANLKGIDEEASITKLTNTLEQFFELSMEVAVAVPDFLLWNQQMTILSFLSFPNCEEVLRKEWRIRLDIGVDWLDAIPIQNPYLPPSSGNMLDHRRIEELKTRDRRANEEVATLEEKHNGIGSVLTKMAQDFDWSDKLWNDDMVVTDMRRFIQWIRICLHSRELLYLDLKVASIYDIIDVYHVEFDRRCSNQKYVIKRNVEDWRVIFNNAYHDNVTGFLDMMTTELGILPVRHCYAG